jgi:VWFA-related protein
MSFSRRSVLRATLPLLLSKLRAQEPTFSSAVRVVNLLANVRTRKGAIVSDLSKDDFQVFEDSRPQVIKYFARQSDLPLMLGLMVDTSMSQDKVLDQERAACFRFLDSVLRPNKDKVFIQQFDSRIIVRQELTSSWKDLNESLNQVDTPSRKQLTNGIGTGTRLYDAMIESANAMKTQQGRKAVIVMTDGDDNDSEATLSASIEAAVKADLLIYSILFGGRAGQRVLEQMSRETGGGYFEVSKKASIDDIFDTIQNELRNQYSIGYVSDKVPDIGEFRKIQLKTTDKTLSVQTRERYWATP